KRKFTRQQGIRDSALASTGPTCMTPIRKPEQNKVPAMETIPFERLKRMNATNLDFRLGTLRSAHVQDQCHRKLCTTAISTETADAQRKCGSMTCNSHARTPSWTAKPMAPT